MYSSLRPHIEGVGQERFLFGATPPNIFSQVSYTLRFDEESRSFIINCGIAHGITTGATFDVKLNPGSNPSQLGVLFVIKAMCFSSLVDLTHEHSQPCLNLQSASLFQRRGGIKPQQLRLFVIKNNNKRQTSQEFISSLLKNAENNLQNVTVVDKPDDAHLEVSVNGSRANFQLVDPRARKHGLRYRYPRIEPEEAKVASFLQASSDYLWELDRRSTVPGLADDIEVAFYPLTKASTSTTSGNTIGMTLTPLDDQNLLKDNEIDIVVGDDHHFGIKLVNHGHHDIFPVIQYFDCRSLTIPGRSFSFFENIHT